MSPPCFCLSVLFPHRERDRSEDKHLRDEFRACVGHRHGECFSSTPPVFNHQRESSDTSGSSILAPSNRLTLIKKKKGGKKKCAGRGLSISDWWQISLLFSICRTIRFLFSGRIANIWCLLSLIFPVFSMWKPWCVLSSWQSNVLSLKGFFFSFLALQELCKKKKKKEASIRIFFHKVLEAESADTVTSRDVESSNCRHLRVLFWIYPLKKP